ncbi:MAG: FeoA family protein [Saprospiraceae bacterium]
MSLAIQLVPGEHAMIVRYSDEKVAGKLISMGMMPGSQLMMIRKAPFGGGYYVRIDGINVALRENEMKSIVVG